MDKKVKILIDKGNATLNGPFISKSFTNDPKADILSNDIEKHPHFFVLGCVMDRQIQAERAWIIPYKVSQVIDGVAFKDFLNLTQKQIEQIFVENRLHRFNKVMSKAFYESLQQIHTKWNNDASNIWLNNQSCASVIRSFLAFNGVGVKIATMAANILIRYFKVPLKDKRYIDLVIPAPCLPKRQYMQESRSILPIGVD